MTQVKISLSTINDVKTFNTIVNQVGCEVDITSGKYVVDAKSIMGIFSLDLSKPLNLTIHADNCNDLLEELEKYILK